MFNSEPHLYAKKKHRHHLRIYALKKMKHANLLAFEYFVSTLCLYPACITTIHYFSFSFSACIHSRPLPPWADRLHSARLLPWIGRLHSTRQPPSPSPPLHPRPAMVLPPSAPPKMTTAPMQWSRGPRYATAPWGYRHHRHLHHHELGCNRTETTMTRSAFKLNWSCRRTSRGPCAGRAGLARSSSPHFPCPSTCEGILRTLAVPPRRPC